MSSFNCLPTKKKGSALMTRNKVADYPQASTIFRKRYTTGETTSDTNAIILRNTFSVGLKNLLNTGLGLESGYFNGNGLSQVQLMSINHYPPSSDPSLTLGLPKHSDVNLFTILLQAGEVPRLQVLEDRKWLAVDPLPTAFVITIGYVFQVISNRKLKSVDHMVVRNSKVAQTTVGNCIFPSSDSRIEPAKALVDKCHPPLYKSFIFKDFSDTYISEIINGITTERYKIHLSE
ncbi:hypothetical protein POTOM_007396 [Populus tomentosa]|uniref:Fe2OG dioxygenase domain-containing protein n=1 Tax=Populus tomentosa TaxID=118781 RepID=A0A8X8DBQ6_POPTO|nr:hypothetical protein POTOM_007396 [Populus tomentosa]